MKRFKFVLVITFCAVIVSGCASIKGATKKEQRAYILEMQDTALAQLYASTPIAEDQIKDSAGYGTFSNINTNLFILSTGNGFGVVTNKKSGEKTYMKMASVGGGLGMGIKDFRAVIIFRKEDDLLKFVDKGWEFSGQADAALKSGEKGGAVSRAQTADLDVVTYQITSAGVALQATLQGTKYWKHRDLNKN